MANAVERFCSGYSKSPGSNGRLLILYGPTGVGKTHCAKAVDYWAKTMATGLRFVSKPGVVETPYPLFFYWPELLDHMKDGDWRLVDSCSMARLLILDDIGTGHDPSKLGVDKLCRILSAREKKWTLVTTNIPPANWETTFDARVASRLLRGSTSVSLDGVKDYNK